MYTEERQANWEINQGMGEIGGSSIAIGSFQSKGKGVKETSFPCN